MVDKFRFLSYDPVRLLSFLHLSRDCGAALRQLGTDLGLLLIQVPEEHPKEEGAKEAQGHQHGSVEDTVLHRHIGGGQGLVESNHF